MFEGRKYKLLVSLTLALPTLILIFVLYLTGNKGVKEILEAPKILITEADKEYDYILDENNYLSYDEDNDLLIIEADEITYNEVIIKGKLILENPTFFKLGKYYYHYYLDEETKTIKFDKFNEFKLVKDNLIKKGISLGLNVIVMLIAAPIAFYMIMKKMDLMKRHRRLTALIALSITTMVFLFLSLIVKNFLFIFGTITVSFGLYYIEWIIMRKKAGLPLSDYIKREDE